MTRWHELRPVGLELLESAPLIVDVVVTTPLDRTAVWNAFVDPRTWPHWFPRVRSVSYPDQAPPFGVGTRRHADVDGQRFEETILAWDEPTRWTYRIDRCTEDLASAQVESTEFSEAPGGGTRVRWILACEPLEALRGVADALPGILSGLLAEALANLERHLAS